jgi:hypothetical protein
MDFDHYLDRGKEIIRDEKGFFSDFPALPAFGVKEAV